MRLIAALSLALLAACASTRGEPRSESVPSFDDVSIAYDVAGEGEPALVFVHGWCCNRGFWEHQMAAFAREHRVVALDLGGHGDSGDGREPWTIESMARDVVSVVEALELDEVVLVGHSMGGPVSLMAAARLPKQVRGVICVDTLHDVTRERDPEQVEMFLDRIRQDYDEFFREMVRFVLPQGADPALAERIAHEAAHTSPEVAMALMQGFLELDLAALLAACPAPVYCINAAEPNPTNLEANREHDPDFAAEILPDVGHFPMLEKPREFDEALRRALLEVRNARG